MYSEKEILIVFTEEDLRLVLQLLDRNRGGLGNQNKFDKVFDRILVQRMFKKEPQA